MTIFRRTAIQNIYIQPEQKQTLELLQKFNKHRRAICPAARAYHIRHKCPGRDSGGADPGGPRPLPPYPPPPVKGSDVFIKPRRWALSRAEHASCGAPRIGVLPIANLSEKTPGCMCVRGFFKFLNWNFRFCSDEFG